MEPTDDPDLERARRLAEELSLTTDEDVLASCLRRARELGDGGERSDEPAAGTDRGVAADDPDDALLAVYETPRESGADGPLAGVTVAVKDNLAARDLAMTVGLADFSFVPGFDAAVVERLLGAGAAVVGKANMDAFAYGPSGEFSERGQVRNPDYPDRVPGGTSSGSAAAVAAGTVEAALGTDTGGSVRKPAAYCGVVGVKTTHGLVPRHGLVDLVPSLDTIGPIARDVETAARALAAVAGHDRRDPTSSHVSPEPYATGLDDPPDLTVGLPDGFLDCAVGPVREAIDDVAADLDALDGVAVREVPLANDVSRTAYPHVVGAEAAWTLRQRGVVRGQGTWYDGSWREAYDALFETAFNDHITRRMLPGVLLDEETGGRSYVRARRGALAFERRLAETFEAVDLLLSPTVPVLPPRLDADEEPPVHQAANTRPFNLAGTPAVAVPAGERRGLPVSAQVVAPAFRDRLALQGARLVERATG